MFRDLSCTMHRHNVHWRGGEGGNGQTESARPTYDEKYKIQNTKYKMQNAKHKIQNAMGNSKTESTRPTYILRGMKNMKYKIHNT